MSCKLRLDKLQITLGTHLCSPSFPCHHLGRQNHRRLASREKLTELVKQTLAGLDEILNQPPVLKMFGSRGHFLVRLILPANWMNKSHSSPGTSVIGVASPCAHVPVLYPSSYRVGLDKRVLGVGLVTR